MSIMTSSFLMIVAIKKVIPQLSKFEKPLLEFQLALYIYYQVQFKEKSIQAQINLGSKIDVMSLKFDKKLGLCIQKTKLDT